MTTITVSKSSTNGAGDIYGPSWENSVNALMLSQQRADEVKNTTAAIAQLMSRHASLANAVKGDPDLNETGKQKKLAALVIQHDRAVATITSPTLNDLEAETQTLTQALANASSMNPTVQETMLIIERRALAAELDPLIAESKVLELAANGKDDMSVIAMVTAPEIAPLVRPEIAARARDLMGARSLPDKAEGLRQARESLAILRNAVSTAGHQFATPHERAVFGIDAITRDAVPAKDAPQA